MAGTENFFSSTGGVENDAKTSDVNAQAIFDSLSIIPNTVYLLWTEYATDYMKQKLEDGSKSANIEEKYLLCVSLWFLFAISGVSSSIFIVLISLAMPGFESLKAIESGNPGLIRRWLKYWVVFGVVNAVEFVIPIVVAKALSISFFKGCLLLWCILPIKPNGTELVYSRFINSRAREDIEATARVLESYLRMLRKRDLPQYIAAKQFVTECAVAGLDPSLKDMEAHLSSLGPDGTSVAPSAAPLPEFELVLPERKEPGIFAEHYRKPLLVAVGAGVPEITISDPQKAASKNAKGHKGKTDSSKNSLSKQKLSKEPGKGQYS
ncbi:receptor expression-enhancing protein 4-like [Varroa destructor]|uniref:Receptor expression-enhancing protein n=2 Tax=Varroa TaxID=62624 RepID=A0A7M7K901_VARDE|nr:receptor expression-enhancing protein 4-like [Varroa destructor]